jgi:hypothetical protein
VEAYGGFLFTGAGVSIIERDGKNPAARAESTLLLRARSLEVGFFLGGTLAPRQAVEVRSHDLAHDIAAGEMYGRAAWQIAVVLRIARNAFFKLVSCKA